MALEPSSAPTTGELRRFGLVTAAAMASLFGAILPWLRHRAVPLWPWAAAAALAAAALGLPSALGPVHRWWMRFGRIAGAVNTRIVLTLAFFLVFTPVGLVMRILGHDPLRRRFDPEAASYRVPSRPINPQDMERPF